MPAWPGLLGRIALFVLGFVVTGIFFRAVASPDGGGLVGSKLQYYRPRAAEFDTVFLGSSHVFRAVVPEVFDSTLAERGVTTHSFNFGVQLPHLIESRHLLQQILAAGEDHLERVFYEYQTFTPQLDPNNDFIPRTIYWHDLEQTSLAIERGVHWIDELGDEMTYVEDPSKRYSILGILGRTLPARWRLASNHIQHFLLRTLMVGRGKDIARGSLMRQHGAVVRQGPARGYISLEAEDRFLANQGQVKNAYQKRHDHFLESTAEFEARVEALRQSDGVLFGDEEWMSAEIIQVHDLEIIRLMIEDAREVGVELILVIMPSNSCNRPVEARLADLGAPVLRYNLPGEYELFYQSDMRFDSGHFSEAGAIEFSRVLAEEYSQLP